MGNIIDQKAKAARDLEVPHDLDNKNYRGLYIILEEFFPKRGGRGVTSVT